MHVFKLSSVAAAVLLSGCATTSMSPAEMADCLQPNRRVAVEIVGTKPAPAPKPKPAAEPAAKPAAEPAAKPAAKPEMVPTELTALAQGNSAFDMGSAVLKAEGKTELDQLVASISKGSVTVGAVVISGHVDRLELAKGGKTLAEDRAKAAKDYLVSKGVSEKLIFWEGKDAKEPIPVTKFCE